MTLGNVYVYMRQIRGSVLPPAERGVLLAILSYADRDGTNAEMGHSTLAQDLRISDRQVRRHIAAIRAKGFLRETRPGRRGPQGDVPARYSVVRPTGRIVPADLPDTSAAKSQDSTGHKRPPCEATDADASLSASGDREDSKIAGVPLGSGSPAVGLSNDRDGAALVRTTTDVPRAAGFACYHCRCLPEQPHAATCPYVPKGNR